MWVFCCGMYRSASTLQFQVTTQLVHEANVGQQVGWIDAKRFAEVRDADTEPNTLKVVKVHECTDLISAEFLRGNAIGIYTFRDIRDVYISSMTQRLKSFAEVWQEGFIENCLENYQRWTSLPNVLVSHYESIMADLTQEVRRIAAHLNLSIQPATCEAIAHNYALDVQQERVKQFKEQLLKTPLNPNDHRQIVDYHDETTLLHMNHISSAKVGRWRSDLSQAEIAAIENNVHDWCAQRGYPPSTFLRT
jgi:Sulfotransferase domain